MPKTKTKKQAEPLSGSPTFVATFEDGVVTRMTVFTTPDNLDVERGKKLARYAYESRTKKTPPPSSRPTSNTPVRCLEPTAPSSLRTNKKTPSQGAPMKNARVGLACGRRHPNARLGILGHARAHRFRARTALPSAPRPRPESPGRGLETRRVLPRLHRGNHARACFLDDLMVELVRAETRDSPPHGASSPVNA